MMKTLMTVDSFQIKIKNDVDMMAIVLLKAFQKAEPNHLISKYPASYIATFADMARAAIKAVPDLTGTPEDFIMRNK